MQKSFQFYFMTIHEGWLSLAVVLDLFSRQVVGWSMHSNSRMHVDLVLNALIMAVWRRKTERARYRLF